MAEYFAIVVFIINMTIQVWRLNSHLPTEKQQKLKQLTNVRASGTDEALTLTPALEYTLEQALEFIEDDELVEVTPKSIRIRKRYLTENERKRNRDK